MKINKLLKNETVWAELEPHEIHARYEGNTVFIRAQEEFTDPVEYWWKETDCFTSNSKAREFVESCDNPFWFCTIQVQIISKEGYVGEAYLGCCNYKSGLSFVDEWEYLSDMIEEALEALEAQKEG